MYIKVEMHLLKKDLKVFKYKKGGDEKTMILLSGFFILTYIRYFIELNKLFYIIINNK